MPNDHLSKHSKGTSKFKKTLQAIFQLAKKNINQYQFITPKFSSGKDKFNPNTSTT